MRNLFLILATVAAVASVGCDSSEKYASSSRVEWQFEIDRLDRASASTNADVATVKAEIAEIKLAIREIPKVIKPAKAERTTLCSLGIQSGTSDTLPDYDDEPETVVEPEVVAAPVQTYSGPKSYGAARTNGYKTIQKTRKVARTVYEDEPYEVKVPVAVRDVYQTVQEQVPVSVTKTRMRTETRQRTKTVMVPQQVTEDYTVSVPETYTETVMTTRSKRVKVDTEEVAVAAPAPVAAPVTYAAAPVSCVDCVECTDCVQAPVMAMPYVSAPIAAPATFYNVSQTVAAPVYAAPSQLMASIPVSVATPRQPRLRPLATATRAYSTVRRQNQVNRRCSNGQCKFN